MNSSDAVRYDEPSLVAALLSGNPPLSRNRNFELLSSDVGRRARRRASYLRSIGRDLERLRSENGAVTVDLGDFARGDVRVSIHHEQFVRRAYLTNSEVELLSRVFPLAARVLDVSDAPAE